MDSHDEEYVTFPLSNVHDEMQQTVISHEEICEPVEECVLDDDLTEIPVNETNSTITETHVAVTILNDGQSDDDDDGSSVYPIYIKEEHQYTSGDDESMAVEALRQLGGMYPNFNEKKIGCSNCSNTFTQAEFVKHHQTCVPDKFACSTCGEKFERKIDLVNHTVCHQVDRPHACRTCGNLFKSKSLLQAHMTEYHQIERPHKCAICGADFMRPSSLSNHMKIHTYVAGRAIMQAQDNNVGQSTESFRKWSENNVNETQTISVPSSSVQIIQNYDVSQVQWSVPGYTFTNEQVVNSLGSQDKLDTLQEFTVMPNGEVTQFEYAAQSEIANQIGDYNLSLNSFCTSDAMVKVESLTFNDNRRNFNEVEIIENKAYTCNQCGVSFSRPNALTTHEKTHNVKTWATPIECKYCDKQFQDENHLSTHQQTCAKRIMQNCSEQGLPNSRWGKHACSECGKKFTTKQKMFRHQWIHRKKTHSCEVCGTQFEKQNQLDEHRLAAHPGDSPFTCNECGKSFVSRQGLWEHGRMHAGSPAHFQCDACSKTFSSRQGYLIHHRTHTGERPYGCKFCWKAFRDGGTLRKHERIHTGERPHVCPLCTRAFNQKVVLREHVRWVHAAGKNETGISGPPFPCPLCGSLNQDRDELCAHIVKHSDQMIAEAKAKTLANNNAPKSSATTTKKKKKSGSTSKMPENLITPTEQNEALLSITDSSMKSDDCQIIDGQIEIPYREDDDIPSDHGNLTIDNDLINSTSHVEVITTTTTHFIPFEKLNDAMEILPDKQGNTLHLISKQNENSPVLAIPNPQGSDNFSSQIAHISNSDLPMNVVTHVVKNVVRNLKSDVNDETNLMHDEDLKNVIHESQYDSDDADEMVCGICGEDFHDKNLLMEHVKIHI
ncbi:zinc finger protein 814-like [Leptopilina heterotoma]|uniref:zinc finger protein 814-like n=1 Tax=Leptopilina heterotoma TaxID=63436 RepID=UPI001CA81060|nr:zinc finger protein 814-like [Leptopilina heterotoma]